MPKGTQKKPRAAVALQFEIVEVGTPDRFSLLAARLTVMGIDPVEATRRARAFKRECEAREQATRESET